MLTRNREEHVFVVDCFVVYSCIICLFLFHVTAKNDALDRSHGESKAAAGSSGASVLPLKRGGECG